MLCNSKRFRLASSTPLMQPAAVEKLGYLGDTTMVKDILDNKFTPQHDFDGYTNIFMSFIAKRPRLPSFSEVVSIQSFVDYWSKA